MSNHCTSNTQSIGQELIIMTKVPVPGMTKTRLMPHLSPERCAAFHFACLTDLAELSQKLEQPTRVCYAGQICSEFHSLFVPGTRFTPQQGPDLGQRMAHAFEQSLQVNHSAVMIGADLPHLPLTILRQAFSAMATHDVVLGPALDGGYYLIGLKRLIPELFLDLPWGSSQVLTKTLAIIEELQLSYTLLDYLRDLDTIDDLYAFLDDPANQDLHAWQYLKRTISRK